MSEEKLSKVQKRAIIAIYDFDEAKSYLQIIESEMVDMLRIALIMTSVIAYCRPFLNSNPGSNNESIPRTNLNPKKIFSKEEFEFHKKILDIRNSVIAHSDYDYRNSAVIGESKYGYSFAAKQTHLYLVDFDIKYFLRIIEKMSLEAHNESFSLQEKISSQKSNV